MPDTKITALTAITTVNPATSPLVIVDLTDTSMAASGTTKKVTVNQLLGSGGTATLASATLTGDLTVDTNVLRVDTNNNRVGILTATPAYPLDVNGVARIGTTNPLLRLDTGTNSGFIDYNDTRLQLHAGALPMFFVAGSTLKMTLDASGNLLVGTTSTAGSGTNATVSVFGGIKTASGTTSIGPSVATTIFTIATNLRGKYSVVAYIANGGVANTIMADIVWDGTNARLVAQNSSNLTVTVSGAAIQLTQTVGGTQNYFWSVVWQAT